VNKTKPRTFRLNTMVEEVLNGNDITQ
jgi:hypothetical protein